MNNGLFNLDLPPTKEHADDLPQPAIAAVRRLLAWAGDDPQREGLLDTPARHLRYLREFCTPEPFNLTTFSAEGYDEMIVQRDIPFYSICEHHLIPFFGTATVAYLPDRKIVGLSKLARVVRHYARRPQNQERITQLVAMLLHGKLQPRGVAVTLTARHLCLEMRGVEAPGTETTTSKLLGCFRNDASLKQEFFALAS